MTEIVFCQQRSSLFPSSKEENSDKNSSFNATRKEFYESLNSAGALFKTRDDGSQVEEFNEREECRQNSFSLSPESQQSSNQLGSFE